MLHKNIKNFLGLSFRRAEKSLENTAPEKVLFKLMKDINKLWTDIYKYAFFRPNIVIEETEEKSFKEINMDNCVLCGNTFLHELTYNQMKEAEDDISRYPDMEPIMLCVSCCNKLEARMPHKAYMN